MAWVFQLPKKNYEEVDGAVLTNLKHLFKEENNPVVRKSQAIVSGGEKIVLEEEESMSDRSTFSNTQEQKKSQGITRSGKSYGHKIEFGKKEKGTVRKYSFYKTTRSGKKY